MSSDLNGTNENSKWPVKSGIMLALDVENREQAFNLLDKVENDIDVIKFNYPLILSEGLSIITDIKARFDIPIFADLKVADVPVTNDRIVKLASKAGADAIMLHGFIGLDAITSAQNADDDIKLFLITQLTNPGGLEFTAQFTDEFSNIARHMNLSGVQAPGNRPEVVNKVRGIVGPDLMIVCCGVGAQGGLYGHAIAAGADFEIIGRAIYQADNPKATVRDIKQEIQKQRDLVSVKGFKIAEAVG